MPLEDFRQCRYRRLFAQMVLGLSAVLQQRLERLREQGQTTDALRELLERRRAGGFLSVEEGRTRTRDMIAAKRAGRGP